MAQVILFNVTNGLIIGAFYVLMALGLSLILNLSNVINFAHGNFLALGGYLAFTLSPALGYWGALLVSPVLTALIGLVVERLIVRRIYNRDPVYSLLLTFGLAFVIANCVSIEGTPPPVSKSCTLNVLRSGAPYLLTVSSRKAKSARFIGRSEHR